MRIALRAIFSVGDKVSDWTYDIHTKDDINEAVYRLVEALIRDKKGVIQTLENSIRHTVPNCDFRKTGLPLKSLGK